MMSAHTARQNFDGREQIFKNVDLPSDAIQFVSMRAAELEACMKEWIQRSKLNT